jgi:hypothetical protein
VPSAPPGQRPRQRAARSTASGSLACQCGGTGSLGAHTAADLRPRADPESEPPCASPTALSVATSPRAKSASKLTGSHCRPDPGHSLRLVSCRWSCFRVCGADFRARRPGHPPGPAGSGPMSPPQAAGPHAHPGAAGGGCLFALLVKNLDLRAYSNVGALPKFPLGRRLSSTQSILLEAKTRCYTVSLGRGRPPAAVESHPNSQPYRSLGNHLPHPQHYSATASPSSAWRLPTACTDSAANQTAHVGSSSEGALKPVLEAAARYLF